MSASNFARLAGESNFYVFTLFVACFKYIRPLFDQVYFHCNFFLSLLTTPNSFFLDGIKDSEMYTFLSLSVASEEILETLLPAASVLSISIELISDAYTGKLYDHLVVFTFVKCW